MEPNRRSRGQSQAQDRGLAAKVTTEERRLAAQAEERRLAVRMKSKN